MSVGHSGCEVMLCPLIRDAACVMPAPCGPGWTVTSLARPPTPHFTRWPVITLGNSQLFLLSRTGRGSQQHRSAVPGLGANPCAPCHLDKLLNLVSRWGKWYYLRALVRT